MCQADEERLSGGPGFELDQRRRLQKEQSSKCGEEERPASAANKDEAMNKDEPSLDSPALSQ